MAPFSVEISEIQVALDDDRRGEAEVLAVAVVFTTTALLDALAVPVIVVEDELAEVEVALAETVAAIDVDTDDLEIVVVNEAGTEVEGLVVDVEMFEAEDIVAFGATTTLEDAASPAVEAEYKAMLFH